LSQPAKWLPSPTLFYFSHRLFINMSVKRA
jgi:hypothetical protein